jgi:ADP-dependent NAD(P)H-hydrate dehydratase
MSSPEPVVVTPEVLRAWPLPELQSSKEARGRALVVGGSASTPGAVLLAAESAMRAGAGKVQVVTVTSTAAPLGVALPEGKVVGVAATGTGDIAASAAEQILELAGRCSAVLLGPGIVDTQAAVDLLDVLVPQLRCTVVIDALATAWVTRNQDGLGHLDGRAVLTANLTETSRMLGEDEDAVSDDPWSAATRLADRVGAVVSAGGPVTWTADRDGRTWQGSVGGPGLGTAGSGDVKAGVVLGLCARGAEPDQAAVWGTHLHGSAGDRLSAEVGPTGFLAREVSARVPVVLAELG